MELRLEELGDVQRNPTQGSLVEPGGAQLSRAPRSRLEPNPAEPPEPGAGQRSLVELRPDELSEALRSPVQRTPVEPGGPKWNPVELSLEELS